MFGIVVLGLWAPGPESSSRCSWAGLGTNMPHEEHFVHNRRPQPVEQGSHKERSATGKKARCNIFVTFIKDLDLRTKSAIKNKSAFRLHGATLFLCEIFGVGWLGVHRASQAGFSLILTAGARV